MPSYQQFVKNIGVLGLLQVSSILKGFLLIPLLVKLMGPLNYGIWTQVIVTVHFFLPFTLLGLNQALIRFISAATKISEIRDQLWSTIVFVFGFASILALLIVSFDSPISAVLDIPSQFIVFIGGILVAKSANQVFLSFIQALQEIKRLALLVLSFELGEVGLIAFFLYKGYGIEGALLAPFILQWVMLALLVILAMQKIGIVFPRFSHLATYLRFGTPLVLGGIAYWALQVSDRYLISFFLGILSVGYYVPAYSFGSILSIAIIPVSMMLSAVLPRFLAQQDTVAIQTYLSRAFKYALLFLIPAFSGLSVLSKQFLEVFTTREVAEHSFLVVPFIALGFLFYGMAAIFIQVLNLHRKTKASALVWAGAAALNVALNIFFIPLWGILGAALATLLAFAATYGLSWRYSSRYLSFPVDWMPVAKSVLASALMAAIITLLEPQGALQLLVVVLIGAFVYGISLVFLGAINKKELQFMLALFKSS